MLIFKRFLPFVQPYLSRMLLAGLLVMGVAAINLALLRLAGMLWDIITVQHDGTRMTELIGVFLAFEDIAHHQVATLQVVGLIAFRSKQRNTFRFAEKRALAMQTGGKQFGVIAAIIEADHERVALDQ